MTASYFADHLAGLPVIGIFRGSSPERTVELCTAAWSAGVRLVEVPAQTSEGMRALAAAVRASGGHPVGAGSITTRAQLDDALAVGASFIVSPGLHSGVAEECHDRGVPLLPGVATSTEIARAVSLGFTWLKAFPASVLTPDWVRAQLGPFPRVSFVATGGIDALNAAEFLDAGCAAVAVGSAFSSAAEIGALRAAISLQD